jgi:photosystem II stability/assembly factor-like uncharacterized protein
MKKIILLFLLLINGSLFSQWFQVQSGTQNLLYDIAFIDANTGYAVGDTGLILRSTNGGLNWSPIQSPATVVLREIIFKTAQTGYVCGYYGVVLKTLNGGSNWIVQKTGANYSLFGISFYDVNTGITVSGAPSVSYTTNGGTNWVIKIISQTWRPSGVSMRNPFQIFVSGTELNQGAAVLLSTNAGDNWSEVLRLNNQYMLEYRLNSICFTDGNTGFTCGVHNTTSSSYAIIYRTSNGGINWVNTCSLSVFSSNMLFDIYFPSAMTGTAVGIYGMILRTTNSGINWGLQTSGTDRYLYGVYFLNGDTGFAVGDSGTILKTTNGGLEAIKPLSNTIPESFQLSQNYPNPFNPTTKIMFSVPTFPLYERGDKGGFVTLKIYDLLGREIITLVNEQLQPGSYEVQWSASNIPSGVYFYRLTTDNFTDTKKMVLIK